MEVNNRCLQVSNEGFESFVLCLAIGTLEAIRANAWLPEAGIWTVGRPAFSSFLLNAEFPPDVKDVIAQMDELSAIQEVSSETDFNQHLDESLAVLVERLRQLPDQYWCARWIDAGHVECDDDTSEPS